LIFRLRASIGRLYRVKAMWLGKTCVARTKPKNAGKTCVARTKPCSPAKAVWLGQTQKMAEKAV